MDWRKVLQRITFAAVILIGLITPCLSTLTAQAQQAACTPSQYKLGECSGEESDDGAIWVKDERHDNGSSDSGGNNDGSDDGGSGDGGAGDGSDHTHDLDIGCELFDSCGDGHGPITISDLASFSPEHVHVTMEPDGWMIIGLPANFYADADTNTQTGELFDTAVTVRFTPISYHWSWGDGTSTTTDSSGASWDELDVKEFTATDTSHTFTEKGTYTIGLSVDYSVELKTGNTDWFPITGTLTADAETLTAIATTADSVIVDEECTKNPSGPGC